MRLIWYIIKPPIIILLKILCRWRIEKEGSNFPSGSVIIVANHISWADIPVLGASFPRRISFMAKEELFRSPIWSFFIRGLGSFPVHRKRIDRRALRQAGELLNKGMALGIFPEGQRSRQAQLQPALPGVVLIALHSDAPLLPVGIYGTEEMDGKGLHWIFRRPQITVHYGKPFHLPPVKDKLTQAQLASQADFIMERIAELLPETYRGVYGEKKGES